MKLNYNLFLRLDIATVLFFLTMYGVSQYFDLTDLKTNILQGIVFFVLGFIFLLATGKLFETKRKS